MSWPIGCATVRSHVSHDDGSPGPCGVFHARVDAWITGRMRVPTLPLRRVPSLRCEGSVAQVANRWRGSVARRSTVLLTASSCGQITSPHPGRGAP